MEIITAIATSVLVIITGWYAYLTNKILKSSEKSLNEQLRPYIIVHLEAIDLLLKIIIKNIGKRPAINVDIKFEPDLDKIDKLVANTNNAICSKPMLKHSYFPPNFEVSNALMLTSEFVTDNTLQRIFSVTVKYEDSSGILYTENYKIDLSTYVYDKKIAEFSSKYFIEEISKELKEITKELKKTNNNKK